MAYEDINTKFVPTADTNQAEVYPTVEGLESIKQGLERLLLTPKGHNPFNREYGSSLYNLLFENNVDLSTIQMFLYMDITRWEPRVSISPGEILVDRVDTNTYIVGCNFIIKDYNVSASVRTTISKE